MRTGKRLSSLSWQVVKLTPTEAELSVLVSITQEIRGDVDIRGKLIGPRSRYASTVEVAYRLQETSYGATAPTMIGKLLIPEPNWWSPSSPLLYRLEVELCQGALVLERWQDTVGLCTSRLLGSGLRLNGRPLCLRGVQRQKLFEDELVQLRREGCNLVVAPWDEPGVCQMTDELGLFALSLGNVAVAGVDASHPSLLGCLYRQDQLADPGLQELLPRHEPKGIEGYIGALLERPPDKPLPPGVAFVVCREELHLPGVKLPRLLLVNDWPAETTAPPGILGWIREE